MAATRNGSEGAAAPGGGPRGPFDEARLLTIGQAADLLGVAHVTLRQWVRAGRIVTHPGRKGGLAVDLVRAGDLAALDPRVRERDLPEASRIELVNGSRGGPGARQGAGPSARPPAPPAAGPTPGGPTTAEWSSELLRELERLRAELAEERARGRARALEFEAAERDLRRFLARPSDTTEALLRGNGAMALGVVPPAGATNGPQRPSPSRGGLPWLALLPALVLGFVARPWLAPGQALAHVDHAARTGPGLTGAQPDLDALAPGLLTATPVPPPSLEPRGGAAVEASAAAVELGADTTLRAEPTADSVVLEETPQHAPASPSGDGAPVAAGSGDFTGRLTARDVRPLDYAASAGPVCALGGHASDLGPCMGPRTLAGDGVAGTHRVDGVDCCRHHQLALRLGGDLAQLAATAELARQDGVLPPLVAARIDRAVGHFLRARFGAWRAAGVDDVQGAGHQVQLDSEGIATVLTWIELEQDVPGGGAADAASVGSEHVRRDLRLVLEVSDGAEGDVLLELVTLTRSTEVAAGAALAAPDANRTAAGTER